MLSSFITVASTVTVIFSTASSAAAVPAREVIIARAVPSGYTYSGCFTEASGQRALTGNSYFDDAMTVEKCASTCSAFTTFGVEYGRECYCGNGRNSGSVSTSEADCSFACGGDSTQKCGAGNRLNVYTRTTPIVPKTYTAKGCRSEPQSGRALAAKVFSDPGMTVEKCAAGCAGFPYFGLEYYNECYCGNYVSAGSTQLTSDKCKYPCAGSSSQTCGGDWALNLYAFDSATTTTTSASSSTSTSAPSSTTTAATVQYVLDGCWTDSASNRALSAAQIFDDSMTVAMCQAICSKFDIFGVEYGRECYCGNTLNASTKKDTSECSQPCVGDASQMCGAGNRLNLYRKSTVSLSSSSSTTTRSSTTTSSSRTTTSSTTTSRTTTTSSTTTRSTTATPTPTRA